MLSPVENVCEEKKNKLPIKVSGCLSEDKDSFDSTPQIRNHKSLDKASLRMQVSDGFLFKKFAPKWNKIRY